MLGKKSKQVNKLFRVSKPYGYHMPDVNNAIFKYNEVVEQLKKSLTDRDKKISRQKKEIAEYQEELERVKGEVRDMHFQMNMMELPDMNEIQEQVILNKFKEERQSTSSSSDKEKDNYEEEVDEEPDLDIPIVGGDETEETVDLNKKDNNDFDIID